MAPIIPSSTLTIKVGDVAATLGNATKNMGGFRGFGGSVPASGALSMSQCQKIQYGVGYYNSWENNPADTNRGSWVDTSITDNSNITCSVWLTSGALNASFRALFHVGVDPYAGSPQNPYVSISAGANTIRCASQRLGGTDVITTFYKIINDYSAQNIILVFSGGTSLIMYFNGGSAETFTIFAPDNALSTQVVWSPNPTYPLTGTDTSLNYLWFFPYAMTAAQASAYYSATSPTVGLYSFSSITFTNAGATGQSGPTTGQCTTAYSGTNPWVTNTSFFNTSSGIQLWTVPQTRNYTFIVAGAGNQKEWLLGNDTYFQSYRYLTYGAIVTVTLSLTKGDVLKILVGQQGTQTVGLFSRGGGNGGTFVYNQTTSAILVAAGGGGGSGSDTDQTGSAGGGAGLQSDPYLDGTGRGYNANTVNTGVGIIGRYTNGGAAGTGGNGGGANTQGFGGQGGGGYSGDGLINTANGEAATAALSFLNGGTGGGGGAGPGGFGGGASAGTAGGAGAGGGGGYSGGGGGANQGNGEGGGGGGSWSTVAWSSIATTNLGMGYVTVS